MSYNCKMISKIKNLVIANYLNFLLSDSLLRKIILDECFQNKIKINFFIYYDHTIKRYKNKN